MALPVCFEALIRSIFVIIKVAIDNWFYTLGFIVLFVLVLKRQMKYVLIGLGAFFALAFILSLFDVTMVCEFANWLAKLFQ